LIGVALIALSAGVLRASGADADWQVELLRFAGMGLLALGGLNAVITFPQSSRLRRRLCPS
jgi:hypothetical protein